MKILVLLSTILLCILCVVFSGKCRNRVCVIRIYTSNNMIDYHIYVNPIHCTHMVLYRAQVSDRQEIFVEGDRYDEVKMVVDLKQSNPLLRTIYAVQNQNFPEFVRMYTTDNLRKNFISNLIKFLRANNIDGVKIDVQPAEGGNKGKFTQMFKELLGAFLAEAVISRKQRLLLSVGIPSDKTFLDRYYDVAAISRYVDMVDLATYYFDFPMNTFSPEHHSPLYSKDASSTKTIDYMARYVAGKGVKKSLINIGLSVMTINYLRFSENSRYIKLPAFLAYGEACGIFFTEIKRSELEPEKGRVVDFDKNQNFYMQKLFYDDPETFKAKVKYVKDNGYGGVMLFSVREDDPYNECKNGQYPLLKAAYDECSSD